MLRMITITLLSVLALGAQDKKAIAKIAAEARPVNSAIKPRDSNLPSLSAFEVVKNFTVGAQDHQLYTMKSDFTGADRVSVALNCTAGSAVKNVGLVVAWSNPLSDFYTTTDIIFGSDFVSSTGGGAVVPAYGSALAIDIVNVGTAPITCNQLTAYAVVH